MHVDSVEYIQLIVSICNSNFRSWLYDYWFLYFFDWFDLLLSSQWQNLCARFWRFQFVDSFVKWRSQFTTISSLTARRILRFMLSFSRVQLFIPYLQCQVICCRFWMNLKLFDLNFNLKEQRFLNWLCWSSKIWFGEIWGREEKD